MRGPWRVRRGSFAAGGILLLTGPFRAGIAGGAWPAPRLGLQRKWSAGFPGRHPGAPSPHAKEPPELVGVQPVAANHRTVEEQDRDVQAISPHELWVCVHVDDIDDGQPNCASQGLQLGHHLIAQIAVLPVHDCQPGFGGRGADVVKRRLAQ